MTFNQVVIIKKIVQTVLKNFLSLFQAGCVSFQILPFKKRHGFAQSLSSALL